MIWSTVQDTSVRTSCNFYKLGPYKLEPERSEPCASV
jgi:hypothetical protein